MLKNLQPARNLDDLYVNLCMSNAGISEEENPGFYVDVFEESREYLREALLSDPNLNKTYLIAGQVGSGKSTFINYLPDERIKEKFEVVKIRMDQHLRTQNSEINMTDVLLMIGFHFIESDLIIEEYFEKELKKIFEKHQGILKEEEIFRGLTAIEIAEEILSSLRIIKDKPHYQKIVRRTLSYDEKELVDLLNEILRRYNANLKDPEKKVLLIIDDLDKINDLGALDRVFGNNFRLLEDIQCKKILSIPVHLTATTDGFRPEEGRCHLMELKLDRNPNVLPEREQPDDLLASEVERNRNRLKELFFKRCDPETPLIDDVDLERVIDFSGGVMRQFCQILEIACMNAKVAKTDKILSRHLALAIKKKTHEMSFRFFVNPPRIRMLRRFLKPFNAEDGLDERELKELIGCMLLNLIIVNSNGLLACKLNPLIVKAVEAYSVNPG